MTIWKRCCSQRFKVDPGHRASLSDIVMTFSSPDGFVICGSTKCYLSQHGSLRFFVVGSQSVDIKIYMY